MPPLYSLIIRGLLGNLIKVVFGSRPGTSLKYYLGT